MLLAFPLASAGDDFTPVTACGTFIDQPGHYRLVNDLSTTTIPDPGGFVACVIIASDEVTLDLNGYTISCDLDAPYFSFGVFSDYPNDGVNIMGGTVTDCVIGVEMSGNHSGTVKGMTMTENVLGLEIIAGSEVEIIKNKFLGNFETGISAISSTRTYLSIRASPVSRRMALRNPSYPATAWKATSLDLKWNILASEIPSG
jgi:hypothetical protein